jgi:hypothetical protein
MDYINDFHWVWYGIGFIFCPRLTIMIMLSIYSKGFIPLPLMIIGWIIAILSLSGGESES